MPESVIRRWIRPRSIRSGAIRAIQIGGYLLLASLLHVALLLVAHVRVGASAAFAVTGGLAIGLGILVFVIDARRATRQAAPAELPLENVQNRILARLSAESADAYPTRFASLYALIVFGAGFVLGTVLAFWTDLIVWPLVASSGVTVVVAAVAFLVSRRQYRRDLRWALDYEEPLP